MYTYMWHICTRYTFITPDPSWIGVFSCRYDEGYRNIINIDNSPVVITQMIERNMDRQRELLKWPKHALSSLLLVKHGKTKHECCRSLHDFLPQSPPFLVVQSKSRWNPHFLMSRFAMVSRVSAMRPEMLWLEMDALVGVGWDRDGVTAILNSLLLKMAHL